MITVLTTVVGVMVGLFNISTSESVHHYPRLVERGVTATNREQRLLMVVTDTKDASPAKNVEARSAVASDEKAEAKTSKPHRHKVIARQRNHYERPGFGIGYAEYSRNGPQRPFSN